MRIKLGSSGDTKAWWVNAETFKLPLRIVVQIGRTPSSPTGILNFEGHLTQMSFQTLA